MTADNSAKTLTPTRWEDLGGAREDFFEACSEIITYQAKLARAQNHVNEALHFVDAIEQIDDLSPQSWNLCMAAKRALKKARKKLEKYSNEQSDRDIVSYRRPRNLEDGNDREVEQKELVKRLIALPYNRIREVISLTVSLQLYEERNDLDKRAELLKLLDTESVGHVNTFNYMSERGVVQLVDKSESANVGEAS